MYALIVTVSALAPECASLECAHVAVFVPLPERSQQLSPLAVRPFSRPGFCSRFAGGGGAGSAMTWRTVRTDTSFAGCACSQSSSASRLAALIEFVPQPLSQMLWNVSVSQPPPFWTARVT